MANVAVVLADDYEDVELDRPVADLHDRGHTVTIIGSEIGDVTGKRGGSAEVVLLATDADADRFGALLIPGGFSPDHLRTDGSVVDFVRAMGRSGKPVAAICHAPSLLIEAELVDGKRMTSFPSIRTDLHNAGAEVVDEEVVIDGSIITSRDPDDLDAFCRAILERLDDGHTG